MFYCMFYCSCDRSLKLTEMSTILSCFLIEGRGNRTVNGSAVERVNAGKGSGAMLAEALLTVRRTVMKCNLEGVAMEARRATRSSRPASAAHECVTAPCLCTRLPGPGVCDLASFSIRRAVITSTVVSTTSCTHRPPPVEKINK